jgi:uncharacterized Zn finger protein (UPF0148 family)
MFCPFCGDQFVRRNGELYCASGEMGLSQMLEELLTLQYGGLLHISVERPDFLPYYQGGLEWFCPACGIPLDNELTCGQCGHSLENRVYDLVEFHPHKRVP